ncbi:7257_t:CDS:2, partial [Scutellospora calospora]
MASHILFDNIFNDTHSELSSLQQQIEEFQTTYQSDIKTITSTNNQIELYSDNQEELDELVILDDFILDEPAQFKKLQTIVCCKKKCLQNLIFHEHAITNYQNFQNLNNNQKDMFLLGIISATIRQETTTDNQKRSKLASKYIFEGIEICNDAFLLIYGIGEKYWKNIRNHFMQYGINPRIHKLVGKISNFTILFET